MIFKSSAVIMLFASPISCLADSIRAGAADIKPNHDRRELQTTSWCGKDWADASNSCIFACPGGMDSECPSGTTCFDGISTCGQVQTTNWCGSEWADASSTCSASCPGGLDNECPSGTSCFGGITSCGRRLELVDGAPEADPKRSLQTTTNYCGVDWTDASSSCAIQCPGGMDSECPSGTTCFGDVTSCGSGPAPGPSPTPPGDQLQGYWQKTWAPDYTVTNVNMEVAFSGWADVDNALRDSAAVPLTGTPYFGIGGGSNTGYFTSDSLSKLNTAIQNGQLSAYQGIAYDAEEGDTGLASAFAQSFATAKQHGLKVMVAVSHSAPYGFADADALMDTWFTDPNVDYVSPMLYSGDPSITTNDYSPQGDYDYNHYQGAHAVIVPSITHADQYGDAQQYFSTNFGITLGGYLVYN